MFVSDSNTYDDEMLVDDERAEKVLNGDLELQIYNAIDPRFLLQLVWNLSSPTMFNVQVKLSCEILFQKY